MKDLVGRTLGHYRVETVIGFGGMGQVFRGKHVYLNRPAAIKVMHEHLASHPTFRARFLQEAKSIAALNSPHIVEIYEFGEQDGLLYLVMELVTDGTLSTLLQPDAGQRFQSGKQPPQLLMGLDLIRQAAEGLDAAHALGMIHRDIKPDNLLLNRLGSAEQGSGQYQLKITDFGLARLGESTGLTTGGPVGTPAYMSPEQCQNQNLDGRTDLYSLGVVLYEVVTGRLPFLINSFSDAVQKHTHASPPPLQQVRPDLPPIVEQIIMRCLAKRPEERYQTGKELAEALQQAINHAGLLTIAPLVPPVVTPARPQTPLRPLADQATQHQALAPTKKRGRIPFWLFPVLAAILAVSLILVLVIPLIASSSRGGPPATPLATATSVPLPTFNPTQLYNAVTSRSPFYASPLNQPDSANWDQRSQCSFPGNGYRVTAAPGPNPLTVCLEEANTFSDFAFQAQMTIHSAGSNNADGGGLVFRGTSVTDDIYRWRVGLDGSYDLFNGNLVGPAGSAVSGPILNKPVLLTVIAQGKLIYLYVNRQFISSVYNTFSNQGEIGFMAFAQDQSVDITFTNAQVWRF